MRHRLIPLLLVIAMVATLGLAGCAPTEEPEEQTPPSGETGEEPGEETPSGPVDGGTVYLTMWSEPEILNPLLERDSYSVKIIQGVFSGLTKWNAQELVGDLAESWDVSDDQKTITFHLREGVVWHDGEPFTAEDAAFSIKALMDPDYPGVYFSEVDTIVGAQAYRDGESDEVPGIEVVDDHTLKVTTEIVDATILSNLTRGVVPKHILGDVPLDEWMTHDFSMNPIGTGPFKFVKYETSQYAELEAFDDYFLGRPHVDRVIWQIGDQNAMLASFINQEIDHMDVPVAEVEALERLDFAEIHSYPSGYQWLGINATQERFQDPKVRKALAYALNRQQIVDSLLRGYGMVIDTPYSPESWLHNPDATHYDHNPEKAKELLQEAGWTPNEDGIMEKDGETLAITLIYPTGNLVRMQSAPVVQLNLQAIGIDCEIRSLDFPTLVSRIQPAGRPVQQDDYDLFLMGLGFELDPDLSILFHSKYTWPDGWNLTGYTNDRVDELLDEGVKYVTQEERQPIYHELAAIIADEVPVIYLYGTEAVVAVNNRVKNIEPVPDTVGIMHNVTEWYIPEDQQK